jgi:F-type H+-transporting ATPase subunit delta
MAEVITIARPYAIAAFDVVKNDVNLTKNWSKMLDFLAACINESEVAALVSNPSVTDGDKLDFFTDLVTKALGNIGPRQKNLLALLVENKRLMLLPEISVIFESLRQQAEQVMTADVISAKELTPEQQAKISAVLKNRLGRDVILSTSVDESLLGGAIIKAGDLIIDGSALGKLNRLASAIS